MTVEKNTVISMIIGIILAVPLTVVGMTLNNRILPAPITIIPPQPTASPEPTATPGPIRVFVNGEVAVAAVYELPPDSIVEQAIKAAGGFTIAANTAVVNLAQPLSDGAQVYVPSQDEEVVQPIAGVNPSFMPNSENQEGITVRSDQLLNINIATLEELDSLPGVGPSTAQKILDYRDANGLFPTVEAIMEVSGIGPAKFEQIKTLITVAGE